MIYSHPDFQKLVLGIVENPGEHYRRLVLSDWLLDQGIDEDKAMEAVEPPTLSQYLPVSYYRYGSGSGIGNENGRWVGNGRGVGSGLGIGSGLGSGSGSGLGNGNGSVNGRGFGFGFGFRSEIKEVIMEVGKAYLVVTIDWFAWVGYVKRQVGPWEYEMESCSKIADTNNGDNWHEMAAGDEAARKAASYKHYTMPVILGLGAVAKIKWIGKTPQEDRL